MNSKATYQKSSYEAFVGAMLRNGFLNLSSRTVLIIFLCCTSIVDFLYNFYMLYCFTIYAYIHI